MNFDLGTDQRDAAAGARAVLHRLGLARPPPGPHSRAVRSSPGTRRWPSIGFLGITVAEDAGGAGGSLLDLAVVAEQGGAVLAGPSLVTAARAAVLLADVPELAARARRRVDRASPSSTGRRPRSTPRPPPRSSRSTDGALVVGAGEVTVGAPIDATRGLGHGAAHSTAGCCARTPASSGRGPRQVARGRARRRGPRRRRPGGAAGRRLRQGAAGVRAARSAPTRRSSICWSTRGSASTSCARWSGGRPGRPTTRRRSSRWRRPRRRPTPPRVFEHAAETRHPGARRHRLHLGARRAPVLAAREGRPAAARRRGRAPRRRRPPRRRRSPRHLRRREITELRLRGRGRRRDDHAAPPGAAERVHADHGRRARRGRGARPTPTTPSGWSS